MQSLTNLHMRKIWGLRIDEDNFGLRKQIVVRIRERVWRRHKEEHQLKVFKPERNILNRMLFAANIEALSEEVLNCGKDTKALYALINNVAGVRKEN